MPKESKKRWSYFTRKVYERDPLTCPKCTERYGLGSIFRSGLGHLGAIASIGERSEIIPDCYGFFITLPPFCLI
jgi:hypothetical protein